MKHSRQAKNFASLAIMAMVLISLPGSSVGVAIVKVGVGVAGCIGTQLMKEED